MSIADYEYLKRWLSRSEIQEIREGKNELGIALSSQQCRNIMKNISKNYPFRNLLVQRARQNEAITTGQTLN